MNKGGTTLKRPLHGTFFMEGEIWQTIKIKEELMMLLMKKQEKFTY